MDTSMIIEIVGYVGSALVVIAMLMSSIVKLRIINTAGCIISLTYSLITGAYPIALMNACLIIINVYNLAKLFKTTKEYDLVESTKDESLVNYFLNQYADDMKQYFPAFDKNSFSGNAVYVVCCNACPAGILLGNKNANGEIDIKVEYATPTYRDCSVGKFLYDELAKKNVKQLTFAEKENGHEAYLVKMGYTKSGNAFVKKLS